MNEFGELNIPSEYSYKLTEKGKSEVNQAVNILENYNLYIEPKLYYETLKKYNDIKQKFLQIKERINVAGFLGVVWYMGIIYFSFIEKSTFVSFIFSTLLLLIMIYLFVYKNDFDTF